MGIYLPNMEMPKDKAVSLIICPSGTIYYDYLKVAGKAVPVPPHGRLIDADALDCSLGIEDRDDYVHWTLDAAPTIIPASEEE